MSAALRAHYRAWYVARRTTAMDAADESWSPAFEGLHFWHRLRVRCMYGHPLF